MKKEKKILNNPRKRWVKRGFVSESAMVNFLTRQYNFYNINGGTTLRETKWIKREFKRVGYFHIIMDGLNEINREIAKISPHADLRGRTDLQPVFKAQQKLMQNIYQRSLSLTSESATPNPYKVASRFFIENTILTPMYGGTDPTFIWQTFSILPYIYLDASCMRPEPHISKIKAIIKKHGYVNSVKTGGEIRKLPSVKERNFTCLIGKSQIRYMTISLIVSCMVRHGFDLDVAEYFRGVLLSRIFWNNQDIPKQIDVTRSSPTIDISWMNIPEVEVPREIKEKIYKGMKVKERNIPIKMNEFEYEWVERLYVYSVITGSAADIRKHNYIKKKFGIRKKEMHNIRLISGILPTVLPTLDELNTTFTE